MNIVIHNPTDSPTRDSRENVAEFEIEWGSENTLTIEYADDRPTETITSAGVTVEAAAAADTPPDA
jgi:hypothetical protein